MALKLANNAASTLASAISAASTSMTLTTGGGSAFPTLGTNDYTLVTLISAANPNIVEIIRVNGISGDVFNPILRGQDGTTALNWNANDLVQTRPTGGAVIGRQPATTVYAGNPNTHVAGDLYDMVWDSTHSVLWECTTAGLAAAAVWTMVSAKTLNNTLDNGSGVAIGNNAVPSGSTGNSGLFTVLLSTQNELLSTFTLNLPTTINIGTTYPDAKIAIVTVLIQGQASSSGGSARFFVNKTSASTFTQLVAQLRPGTDTTNIKYAVSQFMVPLTTGSNPSFSYYINEAGMSSVTGALYLDGFIQ